jgi:hypothetical protein
MHCAYGLQLVGTARAAFVWNFYIHWRLSKFRIGRIIIQDDLNRLALLDDRSTGISSGMIMALVAAVFGFSSRSISIHV